MDLLGSLKWLLKGGGRELFLGRGADGPSFQIVKLMLVSFYSLLFAWDLPTIFQLAYSKLLQYLLRIAYPALQLKQQQNAVLLSNIGQDSFVNLQVEAFCLWTPLSDYFLFRGQ